ncbi:hypothetical protein [Oceanobacillus alkalisoli]|uniref:hypothetical protein n=1 Tax=Oceanobacillus alkalisoli TaxID=2925113 RepID=UPI001EF02C63|nr:hypothetical protein [Oceanobacillus alkalisoli]MCF3942093.1 hypothetical protein [Oceanobacillus alkalisoli]MCG5105047.1 hypothetical protein [Oceanobacillus alkalisoli]
MGYIMPVDRYQYINYQERAVSDKLSVSPVNASFRPILERKHQEVSSEYERLFPSNYKTRTPQHQQAVEETYAEITGKGRIFSETI